MTSASKIQKSARRLRYIMIALLVLIPASNLIGWISINSMTDGALINAGNPDSSGSLEIGTFLPDGAEDYLDFRNSFPLPLSTRFAAFLISMIPGAVLMYGLLVLITLFRLYEAGRIFAPDNVRCFRRLASVLFWWVGAGIVHQPLLSLVLTMNNPPGERVVSIELGSPDLTALLVGAVLWVVAWVMNEGKNLQEEQELTV